MRRSRSRCSGGRVLLPVLVLPLTVPVMIFGVASSQPLTAGPGGFAVPLTLLLAFSLASAVSGPFAAAAALRYGLE